MRRHGVFVVVLLILLIALATRSQSRPPEPAVNAAGGVSVHVPAPAPVMATLRRACFDCHSNETRWPWYATLPGASWLIEQDVSKGRGRLNFSRWTEYGTLERTDLLDRACELAAKRDMPLWQYRILHGEARLSDADIAALCSWSRQEKTRLLEEGS